MDKKEMDRAELMKAGAQDYIHDMACKIADSLKAGRLEDERIYNRALHTTIQAYMEADILTEAEATQPVCEAYQESFGKAEEPEGKAASSNEMWDSMRMTALGDLHEAYEEAAKAHVCDAGPVEAKYISRAHFIAGAYIKLGLITEEDRHNQYLSAYKVDYGIDVGE